MRLVDIKDVKQAFMEKISEDEATIQSIIDELPTTKTGSWQAYQCEKEKHERDAQLSSDIGDFSNLKLKGLLMFLNKNEWIEVVNKSVSHGAYSVGELLERGKDILAIDVPSDGIEVYIGKADQIVADDSITRNGYFQGEKEVPYILVKLQ